MIWAAVHSTTGARTLPHAPPKDRTSTKWPMSWSHMNSCSEFDNANILNGLYGWSHNTTCTLSKYHHHVTSWPLAALDWNLVDQAHRLHIPFLQVLHFISSGAQPNATPSFCFNNNISLFHIHCWCKCNCRQRHYMALLIGRPNNALIYHHFLFRTFLGPDTWI